MFRKYLGNRGDIIEVYRSSILLADFPASIPLWDDLDVENRVKLLGGKLGPRMAGKRMVSQKMIYFHGPPQSLLWAGH